MQSSVPLQHGCAAGSCAQPVPGPGLWPCPAGAHPRLALRYFATVLVAAGLMRRANRPTDVPVEKLRFKAGGHSKRMQ